MTRKLLYVAVTLLIVVAGTASPSYAGVSPSQKNATALIDHLYAAINTHNQNATAALFTPDAIYYDGHATVGRDKISEAAAWSGGYHVKRIAPVAVSGSYATTFADETFMLKPVLQVFHIKDGKINRYWEFVFGTTKPFDNVSFGS